VEVTVVRPDELDATDLASWCRYQQLSPHLDSPFLAPEFVQARSHAGASVRVAVLADDAGTAGFFAYELRGRRAAGPVGGRLADATGLVHRPGFRWDAERLLQACGLSLWAFHNLISEQVPESARHVVRAASPVIELNRGYEHYVDQRRRTSKSFVQTNQRKRRKLEREVGDIRFEFDSRDPEVLRTLMGWKSSQYRGMGEWDRFAEPGIVALVDELLRTRSPNCAGTLSVLFAGDLPAAAHFGLRSPGSLVWWFPAYDPELARYSPGIQLLLMMAEAAAADGVRRINLGHGEQGYKDATKTADLVVAKGLVDDGSAAAVLRRLRLAPRYYVRSLVAGSPRVHRAMARLARGRAG
jgi:CelD/BcsL family acetyltransferase involved in cellulose biosynthesis